MPALAALLWVSTSSAIASELIYSQQSDNQSTYGPSQLWSASGVNSEVADDFNVAADIDRVHAGGFIWGAVNFSGVHIRFYAFGADNKPGALQREYFIAAGDPNVTFDQLSGAIDATLSPAFSATGRHFISVQPVINYWYWWSSSNGAPRGEAFYFRDNATGEAWHHGDNLNTNVNADLVFSLYGTVTGTGVITSLSETTLPRSGFLEIFGSNFGGDGTVLIGGISAPVADWTSTRIVAYVPESAPLETLAVQVVNGAGGSNTKNLTVTTRPAAANHVNWRFRMNGPYSYVRPAIGPDQTVYAVDVFDHLYALAPDGALKWLVRGAGDKGVAVGLNGTIYVASEDYIKAFNPDGSTKWTFVQNPRAFICLGVSVGPDGNIYSVGTEGIGVFSLTPAGALRWQTPEAYDRRIVDYAEILFGQNGSDSNSIFSANNHLRAVRLDGTSVFTIPGWLANLRSDRMEACTRQLRPIRLTAACFGFSTAFSQAATRPPTLAVTGFTTSEICSRSIQWLAALARWTGRLRCWPDCRSAKYEVGSTAVPTLSITPASFALPAPRTDMNSGASFCRSKIQPFGIPRWAVRFQSIVTTTRARFTADGGTVYIHHCDSYRRQQYEQVLRLLSQRRKRNSPQPTR